MILVVMIKTPRLTLREFTLEDFDAVHAYASDLRVVKYMTWGPNTMEETRRFIIGALNKKLEDPRLIYELAVTLNGELIGGCGLTVTNQEERLGEIGYCLRPDMWRRGLGTETCAGLIYYGFKGLDLSKLTAKCDVKNEASFRVMEKNGMLREGRLVENMKIQGTNRDCYIYGITFNDWSNNVSLAFSFS